MQPRRPLNPALTMKINHALTIKISQSSATIVLSSFALAAESAITAFMNEILFMIGDVPIHAAAALTGFAALALILLLAIAVAIARSGNRGAALAEAEAIRADELEQRLEIGRAAWR